MYNKKYYQEGLVGQYLTISFITQINNVHKYLKLSIEHKKARAIVGIARAHASERRLCSVSLIESDN